MCYRRLRLLCSLFFAVAALQLCVRRPEGKKGAGSALDQGPIEKKSPAQVYSKSSFCHNADLFAAPLISDNCVFPSCLFPSVPRCVITLPGATACTALGVSGLFNDTGVNLNQGHNKGKDLYSVDSFVSSPSKPSVSTGASTSAVAKWHCVKESNAESVLHRCIYSVPVGNL